MRTLDQTDKALLEKLQVAVPLAPRPFAELGESLKLSESEVIARVGALRNGTPSVIRQISAIFDSRSLGYQSCLVGAKVEDWKIDAAATEISRHPGVSHN